MVRLNHHFTTDIKLDTDPTSSRLECSCSERLAEFWTLIVLGLKSFAEKCLTHHQIAERIVLQLFEIFVLMSVHLLMSIEPVTQ